MSSTTTISPEIPTQPQPLSLESQTPSHSQSPPQSGGRAARAVKSRSYYNSNSRSKLLERQHGDTTPTMPSSRGPAAPPAVLSLRSVGGARSDNWRLRGNERQLSGQLSVLPTMLPKALVSTLQRRPLQTPLLPTPRMQPLTTQTTPLSLRDARLGIAMEQRPHRESIDITSNDIGAILGRGGSTVARVEREYSVGVHLDRLRLLVTVRGRLEQQVSDAVADIRNIMADNSATSALKAKSMPVIVRAPMRNRERVNAMSSPRAGQASSLPYINKPAVNWRSPSFRRAAAEAVPLDRPAIARQSRRFRWEEMRSRHIVRSNYREAAEVTALSEEAVAAMRATNNNTTVSRIFEPVGAADPDAESLCRQSGGGETHQLNQSLVPYAPIPRPIWLFQQAFAQYGNNWSSVLSQHFERPTPIQAQAWPILLRGHDLIAIAQMGTGKTLAFLLPALVHSDRQLREQAQSGSLGLGPNVLILVPTLELAHKIEAQLKSFTHELVHLVSLVIVDGVEKLDRSGAHLLIGTPCAILDLLDNQQLTISQVNFLVLDAIDRMLEMGLAPQLRRLLGGLRADRQTVLTSTSWPVEVRRLAQCFTRRPIQVRVGPQSVEEAIGQQLVQQSVLVLEAPQKLKELRNLIAHLLPSDKVIVYCGTKARANKLSLQLKEQMCSFVCLHGSLDQMEREQALEEIRLGQKRVLIATELAARGLAIEDVTHIINYDLPRSSEEYLQRLARAGRRAISYVTSSDWTKAKELIRLLEEAQQEVSPELRQLAEGRRQRRRANGDGNASSIEEASSQLDF